MGGRRGHRGDGYACRAVEALGVRGGHAKRHQGQGRAAIAQRRIAAEQNIHIRCAGEGLVIGGISPGRRQAELFDGTKGDLAKPGPGLGMCVELLVGRESPLVVEGGRADLLIENTCRRPGNRRRGRTCSAQRALDTALPILLLRSRLPKNPGETVVDGCFTPGGLNRQRAGIGLVIELSRYAPLIVVRSKVCHGNGARAANLYDVARRQIGLRAPDRRRPAARRNLKVQTVTGKSAGTEAGIDRAEIIARRARAALMRIIGGDPHIEIGAWLRIELRARAHSRWLPVPSLRKPSCVDILPSETQGGIGPDGQH